MINYDYQSEKERIAQDFAYDSVMIQSPDKPCSQCKHFKEANDGGSVCKNKMPPFYRGDYRIRSYVHDSCIKWEGILN